MPNATGHCLVKRAGRQKNTTKGSDTACLRMYADDDEWDECETEEEYSSESYPYSESACSERSSVDFEDCATYSVPQSTSLEMHAAKHVACVGDEMDVLCADGTYRPISMISAADMVLTPSGSAAVQHVIRLPCDHTPVFKMHGVVGCGAVLVGDTWVHLSGGERVTAPAYILMVKPETVHSCVVCVGGRGVGRWVDIGMPYPLNVVEGDGPYSVTTVRSVNGCIVGADAVPVG